MGTVVLAVVLGACGGPGPASSPRTSSSAGSPAAAPAVDHGRLTWDGETRTYRAFVPPSVDRHRPSPLVVMLHDAGGSADSISETTQFDREATASGFIVAYPDSLRGTWNAGFCCGSAPRELIDDLGFLTRLLEQLEAGYRVDPERIYVAGVSNGAVMAYALGCELGDRLAGIASVAGVMLLENCVPHGPLSALEIHGTADPLVPYQGGPMPEFIGAAAPSPPVPAVAERWAELNGCAPQPTTETDPPVTATTWSDCRAHSAVRLLTIHGAGHTWFASEFGPVAGAVDATEEIASFFGLR